MTLVVVDADVLGRQRTGDETYVRNLLRTLRAPAAEAGLRIGAVTRRPDLVPDGVEPIEVGTRSQELRMAWTLPRLLRRLGAALVHTQYAVPLRCPCPAVVTIHDLSFEHGLMGRRDRLVFERVVPRAARRAARVLTVSERSKRDHLIKLARGEGQEEAAAQRRHRRLPVEIRVDWRVPNSSLRAVKAAQETAASWSSGACAAGGSRRECTPSASGS